MTGSKGAVDRTPTRWLRASGRCRGGTDDQFALDYTCDKRWYTAGVTRFDEQGETRALVSHLDISARRALELQVISELTLQSEEMGKRAAELLIARDEAQSANLAKSSFLANMSHEIHTPLGAIYGMANLIAKEPLSATQADRMGKLQTAFRHLSQTINGILDFSKIEADQLVLDDDEFNREIGAILLADAGLVVDVAEDGQMGVEMAASTPYDLILVDMQMPRLDGLEATRQIRAAAACNAVPIVAMTANAFTEDRLRCLDAGMNDFVTKPIEPSVLYQVILQQFRSQAG